MFQIFFEWDINIRGKIISRLALYFNEIFFHSIVNSCAKIKFEYLKITYPLEEYLHKELTTKCYIWCVKF